MQSVAAAHVSSDIPASCASTGDDVRHWLALAFVILAVSEARTEQAHGSPFFGKTVSFKTAWCRPPDKDCGGGLDAISFGRDGSLTEAGMGGDPIRRRHAFGKPHVVRETMDGGTKVEVTTTVTGKDNWIEIVTLHKMRFSNGDSSDKTDRYKLVAVDGSTCELTGNREIIDRPDNRRASLILVTKTCTFR